MKGTNLFDEINSKINETKKDEDLVDTKWQQRAEQNKVKTSIEEIRSDLAGEEENLRKDQREKLFRNRRLHTAIKHDSISSLKDKLTISLELYESCQGFKPTVFNYLIFRLVNFNTISDYSNPKTITTNMLV
jgi:predicted ribosome quality control (RQC) complex YloA/Tae2 family protein